MPEVALLCVGRVSTCIERGRRGDHDYKLAGPMLRRLKTVWRAFSGPLTILGAERKLFFFVLRDSGLCVAIQLPGWIGTLSRWASVTTDLYL